MGWLTLAASRRRRAHCALHPLHRSAPLPPALRRPSACHRPAILTRPLTPGPAPKHSTSTSTSTKSSYPGPSRSVFVLSQRGSCPDRARSSLSPQERARSANSASKGPRPWPWATLCRKVYAISCCEPRHTAKENRFVHCSFSSLPSFFSLETKPKLRLHEFNQAPRLQPELCLQLRHLRPHLRHLPSPTLNPQPPPARPKSVRDRVTGARTFAARETRARILGTTFGARYGRNMHAL